MLLTPIAALCGDKRKPKPMPVSRWKEVKRMKMDSNIVAFTDTLFISFMVKDSFSYHIKNGFIYNGVYTIDEDSLLDFGTARYRMKERKPATLVLLDDQSFHYRQLQTRHSYSEVLLGDCLHLPWATPFQLRSD